MQLTNSREAGAFFLARAIVVAIMYFVTPYVLSPIYLQLFRSGGALLMTVGTLSVGFLAYLVTLLLFLVFRSGFGGVPPRVEVPVVTGRPMGMVPAAVPPGAQSGDSV